MSASALAPLSSILGEKESGQDVRGANVMAVLSVSNVLKSSLGPQGLDKMLVDNVGDVTITNDGATILQQLEVMHPAARLLVQLSDLQDKEVGDGTTSVVLIAAELLRRGNALAKNGIHPTAVIAGYKLAMKESIKYMKERLSCSAGSLGKELLINVAKTTLNSKYIGAESAIFAELIVDSVLAVKTTNFNGDIHCPIAAISVSKCHGRSLKESFLCNGYALPRLGRASQGMPARIEQNVKIALLDFNLRQHRMQMGVSIEINDPEELERVRQKELDITRDNINAVLKAGANVILTTQGIDDMALKYFVEAHAIAVRRVPRRDMQRLSKATGATLVLTLATMDGEIEYNPEWLGTCSSVVEDRVGDWDYLFFNGCSTGRASSIVLRGPNESFLDEVERSVHDALCAVARTLEHDSVSAGGGAVEGALAVYLEDFARTLGSREQMAIAEFAEALLVIPKTLAANAALDSLNVLGKLRRHHHLCQHADTTTNADARWYGLDVTNGDIVNNLKAGVVEPSLSKIKAIRFATEAAVTILRIDDNIKLQPSPDDAQRG